MQTQIQKQLLTVGQIAELLGCSPRHVRRLADRGAMPRPRKLGALIRWSAEEIAEWIDGGCPNCDRRGKGAAR